MEERARENATHKVTVQGRKQAELNGVKDVVSFDAKEVVLWKPSSLRPVITWPSFAYVNWLEIEGATIA